MKVTVLRFTGTASVRIEKAGGECLTFEQLALRALLGQKTALLRGPKKSLEAVRHFGKAPGVPQCYQREGNSRRLAEEETAEDSETKHLSVFQLFYLTIKFFMISCFMKLSFDEILLLECLLVICCVLRVSSSRVPYRIIV